jgi:adenine-specific DNA-methyltransferase
LPESLIREHGFVVVENHVNMIRPLNGTPKVSPAAVTALLNSEIVDHAFRCISGSVAVSAFELEALPLPSLKQASALEKLLAMGAKSATIKRAIQAMYLGERSS